MAKKKTINIGDIFSVKVEKNEFIFGRILFDVVNQCIKKNLDKNNYMGFFNKCFLIETFKGVFSSFDKIDMEKKAVISSFVPVDFFYDYECNIIGNVKVDPKEVSFPEVLSSTNMDYFFSVGLLQFSIKLSETEYENIGVYPSFGTGYWEIIATLDFSNRIDLIEEGDHMDNYFEDSDLRSNPELRKKIYSMIGEDPDQSYYELSLKHGFDLSRLY